MFIFKILKQNSKSIILLLCVEKMANLTIQPFFGDGFKALSPLFLLTKYIVEIMPQKIWLSHCHYKCLRNLVHSDGKVKFLLIVYKKRARPMPAQWRLFRSTQMIQTRSVNTAVITFE